jgi:hypothetical protein
VTCQERDQTVSFCILSQHVAFYCDAWVCSHLHPLIQKVESKQASSQKTKSIIKTNHSQYHTSDRPSDVSR